MIEETRSAIRRLRRLWRLSLQYDKDFRLTQRRVDEMLLMVNEHLVVSGDVHAKRPSQIIVVGQYRRRDYVRVFDVDADSFNQLVEVLKDSFPGSTVGRFDHAVPFSAVYDREKF